MANNDRVADLYHRRVDVTETQDACRDRIHWMCEQVVGKHVLDIGCSQGITAMILAREGHHVLGIDIEPESLQEAREACAKEPDQVQQRVKFRAEDAYSAALEENHYDTVLIGEVLEHLASPERLLDRVQEWLVEGGRLVVTVPHGYHPYHDHKRSFYLHSLLSLLQRRFSVLDVTVVANRFLSAVAVKPPAGREPAPPAPEERRQWEMICNDAIERVSRRTYADRLKWQDERKKLLEQISNLRTRANGLTEERRKLDTQLQIANLRCDHAQAEARVAYREWEEKAQQRMKKLEQELANANGLLEAAEERERESAAEIERLREESERLRGEFEQYQEEATRQRSEIEEQWRQDLEAAKRNEQNYREHWVAEKKLRQEVQESHKTRSEKCDAVTRLFEAEKARRKQAEARVSRLKEQVALYRGELELKQQEVRYKLGDAFVRAARPSLDTLKLPVRLAKLLGEGLRRRRQRKDEARQRRASSLPTMSAQAELPAPPKEPGKPVASPAEAPGQTVAGVTDKPASPSPAVSQPEAAVAVRTPAIVSAEPRNGQSTATRVSAPPSLDAIPTLMPPFAAAPEDQIVRRDLRVAGVMDEFSWRAWQYEADLFTFTPKDWKQEFEAKKPHMVFIESTWSGIGDSWYFQVRDLGKRREVIKHYAIPDVIAWCRQHDIPTVFYNKEDPPNFDVFIDAAKQFDFVFTSDANCIEDYQKHVGHKRVFALPFAAQPRIHNPMMTGSRTGTVCFAGTWYAHRHFQRQEDAHSVLRPALDFDLHIFDRMANSTNQNYRWPDIYLPAVRGALPYAQMLSAYKRYRVFMNINSVTDSPTMFSRRVFELLASGTPVISSYSDGIERLLGGDLVHMSDDEERTRQLLEKLLGDDEYRERLALRGQRKVFGEHTYTHRLNQVLQAIGLESKPVNRPLISVIAPLDDPQQIEAAWENFNRQSYETKELVACCADKKVAEAAERILGETEHVKIVVEEALWGRVMRRVLDAAEGVYLSVMNPSDYYGPDYLTDYAHCMLYSPICVVGKAAHFQSDDGGKPRIVNRDQDYRVVSGVTPWTLMLGREQAKEDAARLGAAQSPWEWWNRLTRQQTRIYAADRFNYVRQGDGKPGSSNGQAAAINPRFAAERSTELEPAFA